MMVLSRSDTKRRRKDDNDILQESPKRTKVHAQRKFAQGSSNLPSPALTPVKDKVKVNGITPPSDVLPVKRPNTEDFLTFLCFRGTKILPARLDFFSNASIPDPQDDDDIGGTSTANMAGPSKSNTRLQEKNNSDKVSGNAGSVKARSQPTSAEGRAVKALKKKYQEQRLAKQKLTTVTKLVQKAKGRHVVHQTRYGTRAAAMQQEKGKKQNRSSPKNVLLHKTKKVVQTKPVKQNITKQLAKRKHSRGGLRSGGQLPPGSDIGVKSPVRKPRTASSAVGSSPAKVSTNKNNKNETKPIASSLSDFSSDDDQPLVKKSKKISIMMRSKAEGKTIATRSKQHSSSSLSTSRPSRKTKEAAALYMEMLGKDLRSPDEYDDDTLSVESFPELPNTKKIELREKELKALAEKNKEDKTVTKKEKLKQSILKKATAVSSSNTPVQKLDDRSKRMLLRNKTKLKMLKEKEKVRKIMAKRWKKSAVITANKNRKIAYTVKAPVTKVKALDKKPVDKKINIRNKQLRFVSKSAVLDTKKSTASLSTSRTRRGSTSLSPSGVRRVSTSLSPSPQRKLVASSERTLRTKQPHTEEYFSESDEEPLRVLSAKLPKKKRSNDITIEEQNLAESKKEIKKSVSRTPSLSPDRKNMPKRDKPKSPLRKVDVKEDNKAVNKNKEEEERKVENEEQSEVTNDKKEIIIKKGRRGKNIQKRKINVKEKVVIKEAIATKEDAKPPSKVVKKRMRKVSNKTSNEIPIPIKQIEKVPDPKSEINLENLEIDNEKKLVKFDKLENVQNKIVKENGPAKKGSKSSAEVKTTATKKGKSSEIISASTNKTEVTKEKMSSNVNSKSNTGKNLSVNKSEKKAVEVIPSVDNEQIIESISKISLEDDTNQLDNTKTLKGCDNSDNKPSSQQTDKLKDVSDSNSKPVTDSSKSTKSLLETNITKAKNEDSKASPLTQTKSDDLKAVGNSNNLTKNIDNNPSLLSNVMKKGKSKDPKVPSGVSKTKTIKSKVVKDIPCDSKSSDNKSVKLETAVLPVDSCKNETECENSKILPGSSNEKCSKTEELKVTPVNNIDVTKPEDLEALSAQFRKSVKCEEDVPNSSTKNKNVSKSDDSKILQKTNKKVTKPVGNKTVGSSVSNNSNNKNTKSEDVKVVLASSNQTPLKVDEKNSSKISESKLETKSETSACNIDAGKNIPETTISPSCSNKTLPEPKEQTNTNRNKQEKLNQTLANIVDNKTEKNVKNIYDSNTSLNQTKFVKKSEKNLSESKNISKSKETKITDSNAKEKQMIPKPRDELNKAQVAPKSTNIEVNKPPTISKKPFEVNVVASASRKPTDQLNKATVVPKQLNEKANKVIPADVSKVVSKDQQINKMTSEKQTEKLIGTPSTLKNPNDETGKVIPTFLVKQTEELSRVPVNSQKANEINKPSAVPKNLDKDLCKTSTNTKKPNEEISRTSFSAKKLNEMDKLLTVCTSKPSEDTNKLPITFTGLLKTQTISSAESEAGSTTKFNVVNPNNIKVMKSEVANQVLSGQTNLTINKPKPGERIISTFDIVTKPPVDKLKEDSDSTTVSKDNKLILKTPVKEKIESFKSDGSNSNVNMDLKINTDSGVSSVKKSRQSVNDTWRLAFKNAKIPKPGQCSPVMTADEKPFVRKPFSSSALKKQIDFDSVKKSDNVPTKTLNQSSSSGNVNIINPFSVNRKTFVTTTPSSSTTATLVVASGSNVPENDNSKSNVIDPEILRMKEAEVEDIVRKYVGGELEKLHADMRKNATLSKEIKTVESVDIFCTSTPTVVTTVATLDKRKPTFVTNISNDKQISGNDNSSNMVMSSDKIKPIVTFTTKITSDITPPQLSKEKPPIDKSITDFPTSKSMLPVRNDSPTTCMSEVTPVGGKHHHLPLPVEQTLKKLQPKVATVSRKQVVSLSSLKSQQQPSQLDVTPSVTMSSVSLPNLQSKEKDPILNQRGTESCYSSDVEELTNINKKSHLNLLTKKKVNMSKEDINKWLNDSTSGGIEHTKNCGIFEKNQCECKPTSFSEVVEEQLVREDVAVNKKVTSLEEVAVKAAPQSVMVETVKVNENVIADKTVVKPKDVNPVSNVKNIPEKKANVGVSMPDKTIDILPIKSDVTVATSTSKTVNVIPERTKSTPDVSNKTNITSIDVVPNTNFSKLKISRGTNKMGDSEPENSSRDPSEVSSPPPRDDVSSADESPEKFVHPERRSIFHQRRLAFRSKLPISRSPSAFSPENESSVYAFEPDLPPTSTPFRRNKSKEGRTVNQQEEDGGPSSTSIAVQVNLDNEAVLECSTQTETDYDESEGHLFYIPLQQNSGETSSGNQQVFQGVAVKLGTEGPDQRVIMRAKLVTKPPATFASSTPRPLAATRDIKGTAARPEQKVKPLSVSSNTPRPPVGTVQPTTRTPNPPEIQPPPPLYSMKRTPTPEKLQKLPQSPETPKKEINIQTTTTTTTTATNSPIVSEKPSKDAPVVTAAADKTKSDPPSIFNKSRKSSPSPNVEKTGKSSPATASKSTKSIASDTVTKESTPTPSTSTAKSKRSKNKGFSSDNRGSGDGNIKLKDAPSFHPTEKEFQDPLEYIEKIRPLAEKYGICRIIPPTNFKPECKVSDDMRFTAYNQYVHKMLHRWGPNVKEMLAIKKYLATQSIALTHPPWIGGMEVDLPKLYQTVQHCGGLKEVIEKKRWQRVADAMRIPKSAQDRVTKLDDIYCKFLLPYDTLSHEERTKLFEDVEKEWEKHISSTNSTIETDSASDSSDISELDECIVKGRNMALNGFYRIARNTMAMHFRSDQPSAHEVEAEFWNHVNTRQSHVCVHSGSIDSGANGYGFPTQKNSSTARHPWNLKVLTNNSGSILRSLGPIMGVTVPTLHVGMVFTACCWYRDPHGLPWIEYLHTGASKIWYGIPDESSNAFREVVMELVPNLCRDKTVWLASDTAMIPPNYLVKRNISICRTVQEPGQFILVFPKAFTSSICTGYLVSESVYFAQPSWLSTAQQIFKDISESSEPSMFSLERLLFSIANDARSHVDVLLQVLPMVQKIKEDEVSHRNKLEKLGLENSERLPLNKRKKSRLAHDDDSDYECEMCRANLFLSLVTNTHEEAVYCMTHAIELLNSKPDHLTYCKLLYTYDVDELDELMDKMKTRIETKSQKKLQNKSHSTATASSSSASQTPGSSTKS